MKTFFLKFESCKVGMCKIMIKLKWMMRMRRAARCNQNCLYFCRHIWLKILHRTYGRLSVHTMLLIYIVNACYTLLRNNDETRIKNPWRGPDGTDQIKEVMLSGIVARKRAGMLNSPLE